MESEQEQVGKTSRREGSVLIAKEERRKHLKEKVETVTGEKRNERKAGGKTGGLKTVALSHRERDR